MEKSQFQFKGFKVIRSLIEKKENIASHGIDVKFIPSGIIRKKESIFELHLGVEIKNANDSIRIEILAVAQFEFDTDLTDKVLNNMFYLNAPALLYPYLRAYISTLTTLSGSDIITLPTLNMSGIGQQLKANTKEV